MVDVSPIRVLVVDDEADARANLCDILELDGYEVETAGSAAEALRRDDWAGLTAILLDRKLPDGSAEELLPRLKQLAPQAAVLIVTGYADLEGAIAAIRTGAADYLLKPVNADMIRFRLAGIVERRRAEEALHKSEEVFHLLVEGVRDYAIFLLDPQGRVASWNAGAERIQGYKAQEVLGKPFACFYGSEDVAEGKPDRVLHKARAQGGVEEEGWRLRQDGSRYWTNSLLTALHDEAGRPRGFVVVTRDMTERKRAQEQALQTERLAAIGQMMTGLAHESGNALARSRACLDMLTWEVQDRPEALDLIGRIQKAQDHLQQLYEEVRGYAAPLHLEREVTDLSGVWRQAWENLALARQGKEAALREETGAVNLDSLVDPFRLEQVFRNILENSLAACADPVRITFRCAEAVLDGRPAVCVAVRDNGPGLTPEQRQRIFEPFFTTKTKGTGLGMAIAERIVEAHGGRIAVGDGPGRGAEILLTLPREAP
jgi:PAS domain S-box-containing protein